MQYALIAGGSKGIGLAIAHAFAKRRYNLILVARHRDKLEEAKQLLVEKYGITVFIIQMDLIKTEAAKEITGFCITNNLAVSILCNVAGIGGTEDYLSAPLNDSRYMIHLNVESMIALTHQMLPVLKENSPAYILNVASMAGFAPIPVKNIYSASKSAVIFFSRALRSQLKTTNISVSCLCPGPVFTKPEIKKETIDKMGWFGKHIAVPPAKVGEIAVNRMLNKDFMIVPGLLPKIISFFVRVLPSKLLVNIYERMIEKSS